MKLDVWDEVTKFEDINDCVDCFNRVLTDLLDILFPPISGVGLD